MQAALEELRASLRAYAAEHGGRFVLFGSMARGDFHVASDVDILVDFALPKQSAAWEFAENECYRLGLSPDIRPSSMCTAEFLDKVARRDHETLAA